MSNTPATTATATPYTDLTRSISTDLGKLRGEIEMVPPGTLPNDGKVIEDARSYK